MDSGLTNDGIDFGIGVSTLSGQELRAMTNSSYSALRGSSQVWICRSSVAHLGGREESVEFTFTSPLKRGDLIALLYSWKGDLLIYLNNKEIFRFNKGSFELDKDASLYGVVELEGSSARSIYLPPTCLSPPTTGSSAEARMRREEIREFYNKFSGASGQGLGSPSLDVYVSGLLIWQVFIGGRSIPLTHDYVYFLQALTTWMQMKFPSTVKSFEPLIYALYNLTTSNYRHSLASQLKNAGLEKVILKALQTSPVNRYRSMQEFRKEVQEATGWQSVPIEFLESHQTALQLGAVYKHKALFEGAIRAVWDVTKWELGCAFCQRILNVLSTAEPGEFGMVVIHRFDRIRRVSPELEKNLAKCFKQDFDDLFVPEGLQAFGEGLSPGKRRGKLSHDDSLSSPVKQEELSSEFQHQKDCQQFMKYLPAKGRDICILAVKENEKEAAMTEFPVRVLDIRQWRIFHENQVASFVLRFVKCLDLSGHFLSKEELTTISIALVENDTLMSLNLSRCGITDAAIESLCTNLVGNPLISVVDISGNNLTFLSCQVFSTAITSSVNEAAVDSSKSHGITHFDISCNPIEDSGVKFLGEWLAGAKSCHRLHVLGLQNVGLTNQGMHFVGNIVHCSPWLKWINLSLNQLSGPVGIRILFQAIESNASVEKVDLQSNPLGITALDGAMPLEALHQAHAVPGGRGKDGREEAGRYHFELTSAWTLQELRLRRCHLKNQGINKLSHILLPKHNEVQHGHIKRLDLAWNEIGVAGGRHLAEILCKPECEIEHLDVRDNRLGEAGGFCSQIQLLTNSLTGSGTEICPHLTYFNIANNRLEAESIRQLSDGLSHMPKLRELHLYDNLNFGLQGTESFVRILDPAKKSCHCLKVLNLSLCNLGNFGAIAVFSALLFANSKLEELELSNNRINGEILKEIVQYLHSPSAKVLKFFNLSLNQMDDSAIKKLEETMTDTSSSRILLPVTGKTDAASKSGERHVDNIYTKSGTHILLAGNRAIID